MEAYANLKPGNPPPVMIWETLQDARRHAYNLGYEYAISHPHLRPVDRTWRVREATPEEVIVSKAVGAFGKLYVDEIGTGQSRPSNAKPMDLTEQTEQFKRELDNND